MEPCFIKVKGRLINLNRITQVKVTDFTLNGKTQYYLSFCGENEESCEISIPFDNEEQAARVLETIHDTFGRDLPA